MADVRILTTEERRQGLGATDVAAVVGVSPWTAPIDVYRSKVLGDEFEPTWRMRMGQLLEAAIADAYAEKESVRLARMSVVFHKVHPFLYVHPDRRVIGDDGLVEIKATTQRDRFEHGPPPDVRVQVQWQMHLTKRSWCDVVVLSSTDDFIRHRVEYDADLATMLEAEAVRFWREHIEKQDPPPVDGSDSFKRWLQALHPEELEPERGATPEEQLLLDELRAVRGQEKEAKEHKQLIENKLREKMGDYGRLVAANATATYRVQDARRVEAYDVAASRVLRVTFRKEPTPNG